jgi:hypothetical protein
MTILADDRTEGAMLTFWIIVGTTKPTKRRFFLAYLTTLSVVEGLIGLMAKC